MLVVFDGKFKGNSEKALLRYWEEWMRAKKRYKKHVQRIYDRNEYCRKHRELRVVEAEIRVLETCINQIHAMRRMKKMRAKSS